MALNIESSDRCERVGREVTEREEDRCGVVSLGFDKRGLSHRP